MCTKPLHKYYSYWASCIPWPLCTAIKGGRGAVATDPSGWYIKSSSIHLSLCAAYCSQPSFYSPFSPVSAPSWPPVLVPGTAFLYMCTHMVSAHLIQPSANLFWLAFYCCMQQEDHLLHAVPNPILKAKRYIAPYMTLFTSSPLLELFFLACFPPASPRVQFP